MAKKPNIEVLTTIPFPESIMQRLKAVNPRIKVSFFPAQSIEDVPPDLWNKVEVLYTDVLLPPVNLVPNLHWVQFHYAGIDYVIDSQLSLKPEIILTSMSGASAVQEGEYILMMLLSLGHRLPELLLNQSKQEWPNDRWEKFIPTELSNSTLGLIGYGSIAREVARLVQPLNVKVLAAKRDVMHPADEGYTIDGHGDPEGNYFHRLYPIEAIKPMLKECDFVVCTLPLTPETKGIISDEVIRALKPGAFFVHISRGGVVDENALAQALVEKRLSAAAMDVFTQEPLPASSPLWKVPNLVLTPHVSGFSPRYKERAGEMFIENLRRYLHEEPLMNTFIPNRHY
jgi:phosphoglycerate dehydrogenase-like enzyme